MLNHISIMGRLTKNPELRTTNSGSSVCNFSVAVDRDFKDKATGERLTDFIDVVAWSHTADFVSKYMAKGSLVAVDGRLQIRHYEDRDGNKRTAAEVVADNVYFAEKKASPSADPIDDLAAVADNFVDLSDDGELPFL